MWKRVFRKRAGFSHLLLIFKCQKRSSSLFYEDSMHESISIFLVESSLQIEVSLVCTFCHGNQEKLGVLAIRLHCWILGHSIWAFILIFDLGRSRKWKINRFYFLFYLQCQFHCVFSFSCTHCLQVSCCKWHKSIAGLHFCCENQLISLSFLVLQGSIIFSLC